MTQAETSRNARGGSATIARYLREICARPLLDREQEVETARRFEERRARLIDRLRKLPAKQRVWLTGERAILDRPLFATLEEWVGRLRRRAEAIDAGESERRVEEIERLLRQAARAREEMLGGNLRLVVHVAKKFVNRGLPFMDLVQEGNIGLMRAVDKFEVERGYRFSTYAFWWIKQAIDRCIAEKSRMIRVPVHLDSKIRRVRQVASELRLERGEEPTAAEIAERLDVDVAEVLRATSEVPQTQSLEDLCDARSDDPVGLQFQVEDTSAESPFDGVVGRELQDGVASLIRELSPRERRIVQLRYGLVGPGAMTLEQIGDEFGLSRERIRQILDHAMRKIASSHAVRRLREDRLTA